MNLTARQVVLAAAFCTSPALLHAQFDFKVDGRQVQIHSFASQGFMSSNDNNYMSMPTSKGSFAFTDGGVSVSSQINDNFRAGAQMYDRNTGAFGNGKPQLDWALGDYKFKSWFGIRGGRVKTTLGLDPTNGYIYASHATVAYTSLGGLQVGGDLRWTTPFGPAFGASYRTHDITGLGTTTRNGPLGPFSQTTNTDQFSQFYGQYEIKGLQLDVEYRKNIRDSNIYFTAVPLHAANDARAWYVAATYKVSKRLEPGAYRSVFTVNTRISSDPPAQHEYDATISGKVTLTNHWYVKAEGHFINGAPTSPSAPSASTPRIIQPVSCQPPMCSFSAPA